MCLTRAFRSNLTMILERTLFIRKQFYREFVSSATAAAEEDDRKQLHAEVKLLNTSQCGPSAFRQYWASCHLNLFQMRLRQSSVWTAAKSSNKFSSLWRFVEVSFYDSDSDLAVIQNLAEGTNISTSIMRSLRNIFVRVVSLRLTLIFTRKLYAFWLPSVCWQKLRYFWILYSLHCALQTVCSVEMIYCILLLSFADKSFPYFSRSHRFNFKT